MDELDRALGAFGLRRDADAEAIRRRYRRLLKELHPDRGGDAGRLRLLIDAHRLLLARLDDHGRLADGAGEAPATDVTRATPPGSGVYDRLRVSLERLGRVDHHDRERGELRARLRFTDGSACCLRVQVSDADPTGDTPVLFTLEHDDPAAPVPSIQAVAARVLADAGC